MSDSQTGRAPARTVPREPAEDRGYAATVRRLSSAQKTTAPGSPAYSRFVNRRIGRYLAAAAHQLGMTPNQVTGLSALCSLAGVVAVATVRPSWAVAAGVAFALLLGYALDSADGQLARLRGGGSKAGEWLDHMVDCAKILAVHGAVLISFYRFFDLRWAAVLLVPLGYQMVESVSFFGMTLNDQIKAAHFASRGGRPPHPARQPSTFRSIAVLPTDYGVLCLSFLLLGVERVFLAVYALLFVANAAFILAASVKWFRDMAALDADVRQT
ncbi:MAG TPA: CDP-alcohol phosphatidyltransferase family protein [Mycobacteriales bacterium]|nr:CDP-alcohol phosphatidyltransferase family protein [Mycobacteriales bacterium]